MTPSTEDPDEIMRRAFGLHEQGQVEAAGELYRRILQIDPRYPDAHYLLGRIEYEGGRPQAAIPHLREALRADTGNPHFQRSLGECFMAMGHYPEAMAYLENAARLDPDNFENWNNLGCACEKLGRLEEASRHFEKALAAAPDSPPVLNNVAMTLKERGRIEEALEKYHRLRDLAPEYDVFWSNYLYTLMFSTRHSAEEVFREHLAFDAQFGTGRHGTVPPPDTIRDPSRKLRLAYFSPDLRAHAVAVFLEGVLGHHDRSRFDVTCFHLGARTDHVSARIQALCDRWIHCPGLGAEALAQRVREQGIDLLVDLAGHTGDNGLAALALKPAPVIATWLGYANTTGLRSVDYRITDTTCDPPGAERWHTEKLWRLPGAQWCYLQPLLDVPVTPSPAAGDGHLRLASFNNAAKLNDEMLQAWARILQRLPDASLLVWGTIGEQADRIREVMRAAGADTRRIEFTAGRTTFAEQLSLLQRTDIALDTYPYAGVTTTFNSLWMGVPVLSRSGPASSARTTLSILSQLGLEDWVAPSADALVELAVRKAADLPALARLRAGLRGRLASSPLMDGPAFARKLEEAYRGMWRAFCEAPGHEKSPSPSA